MLQFQTPIFSPSTRGAWVLRFDDVLADAKELGPLRENAVQLDADTVQRLKSLTPEDVPWEVVDLLARYYLVNRPVDSQWVVLHVTNVDAWFGNEFNRKNIWFSHMDVFGSYIKRCNLMLQQGLYAADVAYFIGEDTPKMTGVCDPALPYGYSFQFSLVKCMKD